ncbi:Rhodanese-like protein [Amniculicola lignicola CBS 123094]|uniref:Rhodanese-like protein n=1 Tax=Amniculicola lignicola CBS 123094 TaxID=1392246 RepID=A0A6A5W4W2_9PLEO|nr:Rhodanese-like protein [Amniculicola lignicola CBS 123094]
MTTSTEVKWYAAYPVARTQPPAAIDRTQLLQLIKESQDDTKDFLLIDLRRVDHEGGTIQGSINLPAQSLFPTIPTLYTLFKAAGLKQVIWYCGSSKGRGNRGAAWFADYIQDQGDEEMKSLVLTDGINGWVKAGEEYVALVDEYKKEVWEKEA